MSYRLIKGNTWYCWTIVWLCLSSAPAFSAGTANPHRPGNDKRSCDSCHLSPDFDDPDTLCSSCHRCGENEGASGCLDCHEHHGTAEVIGLLKKEWVNIAGWPRTFHDMESDCLVCHRSVPKNKEKSELKFEGDVNRLCGECHAQVSCRHPVGITVPGYMKTPKGLSLDANKRITCVTCHRPECYGNNSVSLIGFSRMRGVQTNKICHQCHKPPVKNPHIKVLDRRNCQNCHGIMQKGAGGESGYVFFTNTRLFCLICHPERPHPARDDHRQALSANKSPIMKYIKLDGLGRITCISCHDPHADPRYSNSISAGCIDCHSEYF